MSQKTKVQISTKKIILEAVVICSLLLIGLSFFAGDEYHKISTSIKMADQLINKEKYKEAIVELTSTLDRWSVEKFGLRKKKIVSDIEFYNRLLADSQSYNLGNQRLKEEDWEEAKKFFLDVSSDSPFYSDAQIKIEEAKGQIVDEQIVKAVKEATEGMESARIAEREQGRQEMDALEQRIQELSSDQTHSTSLSYDTSLYFITSIAKIICGVDYNSYYGEYDSYYSGSGSIWFYENEYWVITNEHVLKDVEECLVIITKDSGLAAQDYDEAFQTNQVIMYGVDFDRWFTIPTTGFDVALAILKEVPGNNQPLSLLYDVAMLPNPTDCSDYFPIGTKVAVFGYPSIGSDSVITLTDGIISSFESVGDASYYLTSAKIEQGFSGGLAFTDIREGVSCVVGIPTFVISGQLESLGRILALTEEDIAFWLFSSSGQ